MTFNTALSGLRASNQELEVTGNNIANASTVGFKKSRAEFGDVYANALVGSGGTTAGTGVLVNDIAQQFDQGNISFTDNSLDLAINGGGFFVLSDAGSRTYTRAGYFGLDSQGFIVANNNANLQGYPADADGNVTSGVLGDLQVETADIAPQATSEVEIEFNLDSGAGGSALGDYLAPTGDPYTFDPNTPDSFQASTSLTVYDSQGNPHILTAYFQKDDQVYAADLPSTDPRENQWNVNIYIDDAPATAALAAGTAPSAVLTFDTDGDLLSVDGVTTTPLPNFLVDAWNPVGGVDQAPLSNFTIDVNGSTQRDGEFSISSVDQDGFSAGRLTGVEVDSTGVIFARYNNGEALALGQVVLATFDNPQGLTPLGDTTWAESFESGLAIVGAPESGALGSVQSGALEESNVDLSEELVKLIIAQRNYQANAKTIETADTVTQAIINLR